MGLGTVKSMEQRKKPILAGGYCAGVGECWMGSKCLPCCLALLQLSRLAGTSDEWRWKAEHAFSSESNVNRDSTDASDNCKAQASMDDPDNRTRRRKNTLKYTCTHIETATPRPIVPPAPCHIDNDGD